ncbi:MAG: InlB B-repeat-containing protein [Anaerovoracaceae bacterium]|jgi:LPXTG-motif cell wall-anchored protein
MEKFLTKRNTGIMKMVLPICIVIVLMVSMFPTQKALALTEEEQQRIDAFAAAGRTAIESIKVQLADGTEIGTIEESNGMVKVTYDPAYGSKKVTELGKTGAFVAVKKLIRDQKVKRIGANDEFTPDGVDLSTLNDNDILTAVFVVLTNTFDMSNGTFDSAANQASKLSFVIDGPEAELQLSTRVTLTQKDKNLIEFVPDGATEPDNSKTLYVTAGQTPQVPEDDEFYAPKKEGFVFEGWKTKEGELWDPQEPVNSDTLLFAKFGEIEKTQPEPITPDEPNEEIVTPNSPETEGDVPATTVEKAPGDVKAVKKAAPKTGDESNALLFAGLMALSAITLGGAALRRRGENK